MPVGTCVGLTDGAVEGISVVTVGKTVICVGAIVFCVGFAVIWVGNTVGIIVG